MTEKWFEIIKRAINEYQTPFYLFDEKAICDSIDSLKILENNQLQIDNWFSFKTNPVKQFLVTILKYGLGIEIVSEYEFLAAINLVENPSKIVINGVNKQCWLKKYPYKNLKVNFDSLLEVEELISTAKANSWSIGLRFHPQTEVDPDNQNYTTQFGMTSDEIQEAKKIIRKNNCLIETIHFHIGTQIKEPVLYEAAINETINVCLENEIFPKYFSCGGGFPIHYNNYSHDILFLKKINKYIHSIQDKLNTVERIWFENGRFISGKSAVLVVRINGIKHRNGMRFLICDGGRTNHAFVSEWEKHSYSIYPVKNTQSTIPTTVCGPTCMSYDHFIRDNIPDNIQIGDYFIWEDAGAYHIPWETRFSNGVAKVLWHYDGDFRVIREREPFNRWWSQWI